MSLSSSKQNDRKRKRHPFADEKQQQKPVLRKEEKSRKRKHVKQSGMLLKYGKSIAERPKHYNIPTKDMVSHPVRKVVDAETLQYFGEISSLLSSGSRLDDEERATLVQNALEETQGKECELACEKSCSRVLEVLILSSDATQIASLLHRLSPSFCLVSNDPAGSHVVEALLKAAAVVLHDHNSEAAWFKTLNQAFTLICKVLGERMIETISNVYGSHVVRNLLSVLSGVTCEASCKGTESSSRSARLFIMQNSADIPEHEKAMFPHLSNVLIERLLEAGQESILQLCTDPFASPVLQVMLKVLSRDTNTLSKALRLLLGFNNEEFVEEERMQGQISVQNLRQLMLDRSGSHLVEVMLEVAPDGIYSRMFQEILTPHLVEYSLHHSANFVVQALITSLRKDDQVGLLLAELKPQFWSLIKGARSGIIACILKACQKFRSNEQEVCRSLTKALTLEAGSPSCLAPRLLFLESYGRSNGSSDWKPIFQGKMSVLGCAMLQLIFSYPEECNQQFWISLVAMEPPEILATIKDPGGCHVIERFLSSGAPLKQKNRLIVKLKGYFAELAWQVNSSFTLEKCFSVAKIDMKEAIVSELSAIETDLAKSKHGPHLIRKFDVTGYSKMPDQWRRRTIAKEGTRKAFADVFDLNKDSPHTVRKDKGKALELEPDSELRKKHKKKRRNQLQ